MMNRCFLLAVLFKVVTVDRFASAAPMIRANLTPTGSLEVDPSTEFLAYSRLPPAAAKGKAAAAKGKAQRAEAQAKQQLQTVIDKVQAINDTLGQLDEIINETNVTLNLLIDTVFDGTGNAVDGLNMLMMAAQAVGQFGMQAAADAVTNFVDRVVVHITEAQDKVSSVRENVQGILDTHIADFLVLRDQVAGKFSIALEKVAALEDTEVPTSFLQVDEAVWPFDAIFGSKKKDAFDMAEDAITACNKTVVKVADFLDEVNVSNIDMMTGLVMDTVESVLAQFENRCEATVTAQGDQLPDVLATQANTVCSKSNAIVGKLSPIVQNYEALLTEKITIAQASMQPLFDAVATLMDMVDVAREEKAAAEPQA